MRLSRTRSERGDDTDFLTNCHYALPLLRYSHWQPIWFGVVRNFFEPLVKPAINTHVTRLKPIVAAVFLVLWLPLTSHCLLEGAGLMPDILRCSDTCAPDGKDQGCEGDACCSLESAAYKVDSERPAFITSVLGLLLPVLFHSVEPPAVPQNSLGFLTVTSPELPVTWQFSCRTALPPRAPSFVS